ncbi:MAG TPA: heterodisulfide reductase-related iron-sulfur binding cluster [Bacillota bacterium]
MSPGEARMDRLPVAGAAGGAAAGATAGPAPRDAAGPPAEIEDILSKCVHCGFCLNACPTYDLLREEPDSPRGRIALIGAVAEGRLEPGERFALHMYRCVGCRACETACPAGVEYGRLLEWARALIGPPGAAAAPATGSSGALEGPAARGEGGPPGSAAGRGTGATPAFPLPQAAVRAALRHVLPHPRRVRLVAALARWYSRSWLRKQLRAGLFPGYNGGAGDPAGGSGSDPVGGSAAATLARLDALLPEFPDQFFDPPEVLPAHGPRRYRVGLLSGCVMGTLFAPSNEATVRLLRQAGCEVVIPRAQGCCGALNVHNGDPGGARAMARRNLRAFSPDGPCGNLDAVLVNAAGCGAMMKEYGHLLAGDPTWAGPAAAFAGRVRDVTEFLDEILPETTVGRIDPCRATYQDPCHLSHGQGIRSAPRRLLARIEGLDLVEMPGSDRCCGSAGIYNVVEPGISERMLEAKMQAVASTGADLVVAPNPGCILQIRYGAHRYGPPVRVEHLVDILAAAVEGTGRG